MRYLDIYTLCVIVVTRSTVLVRVAVVQGPGHGPGRDPGRGHGPAVVIETGGGGVGAAGAAVETACRGGSERTSTEDE